MTPVVLDESCAQTAEEVVFVQALDSLLPKALSGLVDLDEVFCVSYGGVILWLTVPDVPSSESPVICNTLQVLYNSNLLGGYWGCSHLWDDFEEEDPESLIVHGPPPVEAARLAATWLQEQLQRPVERHDWTGPWPSSRWVLADTGAVLGSRGLGSAWRTKPPRRATLLRGST